jgi:hypothetical protein
MAERLVLLLWVRLAREAILFRICSMKIVKSWLPLLALLLAAGLALAGCRSHSGSREFIPGKGWVPNDG